MRYKFTYIWIEKSQFIHHFLRAPESPDSDCSTNYEIDLRLHRTFIFGMIDRGSYDEVEWLNVLPVEL